jgi:hypothetical protein
MENGAGSLDGITIDLNIVDDIENRRLGWGRHGIGMEDERITPPPKKKRFSMRSSPTHDQQENKNKKTGPCPEGCIAINRNIRLEETSWGYGKEEVPLREARSQKGL